MKTTKKAWKPKNGEKFWTLYGEACFCEGVESYRKIIRDGNYFRTAKAAQKAARAVREILKKADRG